MGKGQQGDTSLGDRLQPEKTPEIHEIPLKKRDGKLCFLTQLLVVHWRCISILSILLNIYKLGFFVNFDGKTVFAYQFVREVNLQAFVTQFPINFTFITN